MLNHLTGEGRRLANSFVHWLVRYRMRRPIFIIAPPRSGSTYLFELLSCFEGLVHTSHESDRVWWGLFPYHRNDQASDKVEANELDSSTCRTLRRKLYDRAINVTVRRQERLNRKATSWLSDPPTYLDKTVANCFHLPALDRAFPDARYIFLVRDPRPSISSMIEGWANPGMFGKPQLTPLIEKSAAATITHWCYPAPPGWQAQLTRSLPEICAWSWRAHVTFAQEFFRTARTRPILVRYEDLAAKETRVIEDLAGILDLRLTGWAKRRAELPTVSQTTVSAPDPEKWRARREQAILEVLPLIRDTAGELGYAV